MMTKQHFQIHSRSSLPAGYAVDVVVLPLDVPLSENTVKNMCEFIICLASTFMKCVQNYFAEKKINQYL